MYEIKTYQNLNFGEIRTTTNKNGVPLFCLKDICDILEIGEPTNVKTRLTDPNLDLIEVGAQTNEKKDSSPAISEIKMEFVSEAGLYQAVFISKKPNARMFTEWIMSEVLPMIRESDIRLAEYVWNRITSNPRELSNLLLGYQKKIDDLKKENERLKTSADKWDNWIANKHF